MIDIRRRRKAAGMTQAELALSAGVSLPSVNRFECGKRKPQRVTLDRILQALDKAETRQITNGDLLRRRIVSDDMLISNGQVMCAGDRSKCSGDCHRCKKNWLRQPYEADKE